MARKSVLERKTLNKAEREKLQIIKNKLGLKEVDKSSKLTAKKYLDYLKKVELANKKIEDLSSSSSFLGSSNKLSNKLEEASSIEQLNRWLKKPEEILDENYENEVNEWYRQAFIKNVEDAFGSSLNVEDLTYEQIQDLIKRNPHFNFLLQYNRGSELNDNLNIFNISESDIAEAIREETNYYR